MKPKATLDTWVAKNQAGEWEPVKVVDMADTHIARWINYFRRKVEAHPDCGGLGQYELDARIYGSMVTAPAIYSEAAKRGLWKPPKNWSSLLANATIAAGVQNLTQAFAKVGTAAVKAGESLKTLEPALAALQPALSKDALRLDGWSRMLQEKVPTFYHGIIANSGVVRLAANSQTSGQNRIEIVLDALPPGGHHMVDVIVATTINRVQDESRTFWGREMTIALDYSRVTSGAPVAASVPEPVEPGQRRIALEDD